MNMKMIMVFVDADHMSEIERLFEECDVPGYSEVPNVFGKGATGKKLGTRAFPGSSTLYIVAIDEICEEPLKNRLRDFVRSGTLTEGVKMYSLDAKALL